jgi:spermidine synthase
MLIGILIGLAGIRIDSLPKESAIQEIYRANSNFGLLQVFDRTNSNRRFYLNDYLVQNTYDPAAKQSLALFTYMLHDLSRAYTKQINDVLCIGLGVGIVPMQFAREGARVEVAEINPAVVSMAVKYFDLQPEKLNIVFGDGRYYLNRTTNRYDTIILDAFLGDSSPSHLMTREAFGSMRRVLRPDGTVVINCFGELQAGQDFFITSLDKTLKAVFRNVRIHTAGTGNVFFVATDQAEFKSPNPPDPAQIHPSVREVVANAFSGIIQANPAHGRVLRDDFNPVDYYDAANREFIRRQLALSMRPL